MGKRTLSSVKQVINNCLHTEIDIDNLPTYDIEYIFVNLRAKSVNNVIELTLTDDEDEQVYTVPVNIDDIEVVFNKDHKYVIELNDSISIQLKDPNMRDIEKFLSTLPKLTHTIEYVREDGTKVEKIIEGMQSFFT